MNIFKVIASAPRSRFNENFTSAILISLLNPDMEHGLGYNFLNKFLIKIGIEDDIVSKLSKNITDDNDNINIDFYLERGVSNNKIIDIVLIIDNYYYICIENKIYPESTNTEQLIKQIEGIKEDINIKKNEGEFKKEPKFKMVFLVPTEKNTSIQKEAGGLQVLEPDEGILLTWNDISKIIKRIILEEQYCKISPINEHTKYILKAFSVFIQENFNGYNPAKPKKTKQPKNADKGRKTYEEICKDSEIRCVGIQWGENTLLRMPINELQTTEFWCSSQLPPPNQWITKQRFIEIVESRIKEEL